MIERLYQLRRSDDRGLVAVWFALMAVVLFGMAAFAVDTARWYVEAERLQKTVDAAALAGVVHMPANLANANANGRTVAQANLLPIDGTTVTYTGVPGNRPTRYRVTMSHTFTNAFAGILGIPTTTITRTAVADYAGPVPVGSPCNVFGAQGMEEGGWTGNQGNWSDSTACNGVGNYWANIGGYNTNKAQGDAYLAGFCSEAQATGVIEGCAAPGRSTNWSGRTVNQEYNSAGYVFAVRSRAAGTLNLEAYDMAYVAVGSKCVANGTAIPLLTGAYTANSFVTSNAAATRRYRPSANADNVSAFCAGDDQFSGNQGDGGTVTTRITIRRPSPQPWNPLAGQVVCTYDLPGYNSSTPKSALQGSTSNLARYYHRWNTLLGQGGAPSATCPTSVTVGANEDWTVQVQSVGGGGQNKFSLRARVGGSSANVSIFAAGRVSLYNNVAAGTSLFKFIRLDSSAAGHVLNLRFFDLGDASAAVNARILQPGSNTPFAGCVGSGAQNGALTQCRVIATPNTNGGRWQTISIPIPDTYTCSNDADYNACWVRVELSTGDDQQDTTTWSAALEGDPVRLVPDN